MLHREIIKLNNGPIYQLFLLLGIDVHIHVYIDVYGISRYQVVLHV